MATDGGKVQFEFGADASGVVAAAKQVEENVNKAMDASAKATAKYNAELEAQAVAAKNALIAGVKLTDAEKAWTAATIGAEAAAKAKAAALGISIGQVKAMDAALRKQAEAEKLAAEAAAKSAPTFGPKTASQALAASVPQGLKAAASAAESLNEEVGGLGQVAATASSKLEKLSMGAHMLSPELGAAVSGAQGAAKAVELLASTSAGLLTILGPVAVAVGALAGAYYLLSQDIEEANEKAEKAAELSTAAADAAKPWHDIVKQTDDAMALANGTMTEREKAARDASRAVDAAAESERAFLRAQVESAKAAQEGSNATVDTIAAYKRAKDTLAAFEAKAAKTSETAGLLAERTFDLADAAEHERKVVDAAAEARRKAEAAEREWLGVVSESIKYEYRVQDLEKERARTIAANDKIIADAAAKSADQRAEAEETLRVRLIEMDEERTKQYAKGIEDRKELDRQYAESAATVAKSLSDAVTTIAQEESDRRSAIIDKLQTKLSDGEDTLTAKQKAAIKDRISANEDAAIAAFRVSQGAAAATAAVDTILAIENALATVPYPANIAVAAAAGIAGAANEVAILAQAPPTFHGGGVLQPDEVMAKMRAGEGVLTPETTRALGGPQGIARANQTQGASVMGGGSVTFRIGRREVAEIERTGVRAGGPMSRAIRREVRRGPNGAGRSGKGVLA
jgi:hypothetical protein